tara:strand:+ start:428 stop:1483 length:1056 start_codon:yes stop_codon:yes gene_type:complete
MAEDIFSQFYNLFNNGDEVNWKLAEQISQHILKDEDETFILEDTVNKTDIESIFRAVQINLERNLPKEKIETEIIDLKLLNKKEWSSWFMDSSKHFDFTSLDTSSVSLPVDIGNIKSAIIGMQLGNVSGGLAKYSWGISATGLILPQSKTLAINYENLYKRIESLDIDRKKAIFAALALEYITLSLGKFSEPLINLIEVLNKSTGKLLNEIEKLNTEIDIEMTDISKIMENFSENNEINFENIFNDLFAPLSFYREAIIFLAKENSGLEDPSIFDVIIDNSIGEYQDNIFTQLNSKINQFAEHSRKFISYLFESKNPNTVIEILGTQELIPTENELMDPISWAARTSLPPI